MTFGELFDALLDEAGHTQVCLHGAERVSAGIVGFVFRDRPLGEHASGGNWSWVRAVDMVWLRESGCSPMKLAKQLADEARAEHARRGQQ